MSFFNKLLDFVRGINTRNEANVMIQRPKQNFVFGSIISGTYTNYKHDPNPTILCLGCYPRQDGRWMVHGIQLHAAGNQLGYIMGIVRQIKASGIVPNPLGFYNMLKANNPWIIHNCYRTYFIEMSDFKTISPGFSNIPVNYCYGVQDGRDAWINDFNGVKRNPVVNEEALKNSIIQSQNTTKVWD